MTNTRQGPRSAQYLPTEAVQVLHPAGPVLALVPGKRETFRVEHHDGAWRCSCRAETASCGHIQAVKRVVVLASLPGKGVDAAAASTQGRPDLVKQLEWSPPQPVEGEGGSKVDAAAAMTL